jgi:DNA-binding response OmpR family regulator
MGKKVALIDDDQNAVKFLSVLLSENGFEPIVAHDGQAGLKMIEESRRRRDSFYSKNSR